MLEDIANVARRGRWHASGAGGLRRRPGGWISRPGRAGDDDELAGHHGQIDLVQGGDLLLAGPRCKVTPARRSTTFCSDEGDCGSALVEAGARPE